jgi:Ser/Thr protein kinase RdoA (MazF antagonist)
VGQAEAPTRAAAGPGAHAPLSATHSILTPGSVLGALAGRYALDAPVDCRLLKPGLNDSYLVTSSEGRCVARLYGAQRGRSEVAYELELLLHLAAAGVPVAEPLPAADRELTCVLDAPEGPRELALFRFAPGAAISWRDERHCRLAGGLAARIHGAADAFHTGHTRRPLDLEQLADGPVRAVEPFLLQRPDDREFLVGLADDLHGRVARASDRGLDWGPCHGDFGAKNIHLAGGSPTALDFDMCGPGWRAYDLAPAYRATRQAGEDGLWRSFLEGYAVLRPLSPSDLAAVPTFRLLRHLGMLGIYASNAARWGAISLNDAALDRWLAALRTLAAELGPAPRRRARAVSASPDAPRGERPRGAAGVAAAEVGYSLLAPEAVADQIVRSYRFGAPVSCRLLQRGLNDNYLILTSRGRYIARVHRAGAPSAAEVGYELALLAYLSGKGVSVPVPVPAADGGATVALAAPEGTRLLVLFAHSQGAPLSWQAPQHAALVGSTAARIHAASDGFTGPERRTLDLEHLVSRPLAALRPFLEPRAADWRLLCRVAAGLRRRAEAAAEGLDWGPCHGDLRPERIHVDAEGRATVVGFDQCGPGWRVFDFSIIQWGAMGPEGRAYWRAFLRGYADVRPIGRAELRAAPVFHALRHLAALGGRAEGAGEWGTKQIGTAVIDEELAFFRAWEAEHAGGRGDDE